MMCRRSVRSGRRRELVTEFGIFSVFAVFSQYVVFRPVTRTDTLRVCHTLTDNSAEPVSDDRSHIIVFIETSSHVPLLSVSATRSHATALRSHPTDTQHGKHALRAPRSEGTNAHIKQPWDAAAVTVAVTSISMFQ